MRSDANWRALAGKSALAAIVAGLACLPATDANAATFSFTVESGQARVLRTYKAWKHNVCHSLGAKVDITSPPRHGVVNARVVNTTITAAEHGSVDKCAGAPIKGLSIEYKSADGFHGTDGFSVNVFYGDGVRTNDTLIVTVQ